MSDYIGHAITLVLSLGSLAFLYGRYQSKVDSLETRMESNDDRVDHIRDMASRTEQKVGFIESRLSNQEIQGRETLKLVTEIHSAVKVIESRLNSN